MITGWPVNGEIEMDGLAERKEKGGDGETQREREGW